MKKPTFQAPDEFVIYSPRDVESVLDGYALALELDEIERKQRERENRRRREPPEGCTPQGPTHLPNYLK